MKASDESMHPDFKVHKVGGTINKTKCHLSRRVPQVDKVRGRCSVGVTMIRPRDEMLLSEQSRVWLASYYWDQAAGEGEAMGVTGRWKSGVVTMASLSQGEKQGETLLFIYSSTRFMCRFIKNCNSVTLWSC